MATDTQIAEAVGIIFGKLDDRGAEEFERLCIDHGLIWRCPNKHCRANADIDSEQCRECGTGRPRTQRR